MRGNGRVLGLLVWAPSPRRSSAMGVSPRARFGLGRTQADRGERPPPSASGPSRPRSPGERRPPPPFAGGSARRRGGRTKAIVGASAAGGPARRASPSMRHGAHTGGGLWPMSTATLPRAPAPLPWPRTRSRAALLSGPGRVPWGRGRSRRAEERTPWAAEVATPGSRAERVPPSPRPGIVAGLSRRPTAPRVAPGPVAPGTACAVLGPTMALAMA